ncbi:MAG: LysR family transcriptional regulator [Caulobacteraceae bacterium]
MDIESIDLDLLRALDALTAEPNVTSAAARLGISQPAMSARLARLRRVFDDPLLVPTVKGLGLVLTPRAEELKAPLRHALAALANAISRPPSFDPQTSQRTFSIAASDNAAERFCIPLIASLSRAGMEGLSFAIHHPHLARITEEMESGAVDLLIANVRDVDERLIARPFTAETLVMAQRKHHPRGPIPLTLDAYCALGHVTVAATEDASSSVEEQLEAAGRRRQTVASLQSCLLVPSLLAKTDLVSTLPERFLRGFADTLDLFSLPFPLPASGFSAIWHMRCQHDPAHIWLRQHLFELMDEQSGKQRSAPQNTSSLLTPPMI